MVYIHSSIAATNSQSLIEVLDFQACVKKHKYHGHNFTEQPESINGSAVVMGVTGSSCEYQRCSQEGHEHQVEQEEYTVMLKDSSLLVMIVNTYLGFLLFLRVLIRNMVRDLQRP